MFEPPDVGDEWEVQGRGREVHQPPKLVKLSQQQTETGIVILLVEILGAQGPS
jgi:hypothetical protein